jgi:hypothetical protein
MESDTGLSPDALKSYLGDLFVNESLGFDIKEKLDLTLVNEGWNIKVSPRDAV